MNAYTPEDLLEYFYQETSSEKTTGITQALQVNWALRQKYEVICEAASCLDQALVAPRTQAVQAILDYAVEDTAEKSVKPLYTIAALPGAAVLLRN